MKDRDKLVGLLVWQGLQEHRVHDAEDRGIRPDAERKREQNNDGEGGSAAQAAQRVTQVEEQAGHSGRAPGKGRWRACATPGRCYDWTTP